MPLRTFIANATSDVSSSVLASVGGGGAIAAASLLDGHLDAITVIALFVVVVGLNEWSVRRGFRVHRGEEKEDQRALLNEATGGFKREVELLRQTWERVMIDSEGKFAVIQAATAEAKAFRERVAERVTEQGKDIERIQEKLKMARPL